MAGSLKVFLASLEIPIAFRMVCCYTNRIPYSMLLFRQILLILNLISPILRPHLTKKEQDTKQRQEIFKFQISLNKCLLTNPNL